MTKIYEGHEFEVLMFRYQNQLEHLRVLTGYDLRIFSGFLTIQLILGGWLVRTPLPEIWARVGLLIINASLAVLACGLIYLQYKRRLEVIAIVKNISDAFGLNEKGVYLPDRAINDEVSTRRWHRWYISGIVFSFVGLCLILFCG